jgi:GT2 family glycosyltransferase
LVVPRLHNRDGSIQHSVYRFPSVAVAAAVSFVPPRWQPGPIGRHYWLEGASPHDRSTDIDWAIGAVHAIRVAALEGAPPYSERWFMYVEDLELCWQLHQRGWRCRLETASEVMHVGNAAGLQAWGDARSKRWLAATYDWYELARGPAAKQRWALINTLGSGLHAALYAAGALTSRPPARHRRAAAARQLAATLPTHGRAIAGRVEVPGAPPAV